MKKLAYAAALAIASLSLSLCGCGGGDAGKFNQPVTSTSTNSNGMVISLNLAQLSENINYISAQESLDIPTIDSLDIWADIKQDVDSADAAVTYKAAMFGDSIPSFEAAVYDTDGTIMEARVFWNTSSANAGQDVFSAYSCALVRSLSGVDQQTAASMYSIAQSAQYTNGVSQTIAYAYSGNIRCYYMVNGGYHMFVVEPFSNEVQAADVATGKVVYTAVGAAGTANTGGTAAGGSTTGDASAGGTAAGDGSTGSSSATDGSTAGNTAGDSSSGGSVPVTGGTQ